MTLGELRLRLAEKKLRIQMLTVILISLVLIYMVFYFQYIDIQVDHVEEVIIPGVEEEKVFLYLTDLHLAIKTEEDLGAYGNADERIAAFSNERGTASAEQLPQWISFANRNEFDAVLMGGDMMDYYSEENVAYLQEHIGFLEMPYLFTLGKHDLFSPWNEEISEDAAIYDLFQEENPAFQVMEYEDFVICAIDNSEYQVSEASLVAMREWLEENPDKPMILLAHVPFYTENDKELLETSVNVWGQALVIGNGEGTRDTTAVSREFMDLVFGEDSPVVAVFTGDNHFYHKGNLTDSITQWVGIPAYGGDGMAIRVRGNE